MRIFEKFINCSPAQSDMIGIFDDRHWCMLCEIRVYKEYSDLHVDMYHPDHLKQIQYFVNEKPVKPVGVGDGSK